MSKRGKAAEAARPQAAVGPAKIEFREAENWAPGLAGIEAGSQFYVSNTGCSVIVSHDPRAGWHVSIAHQQRLPTWEEVKTARYQFCPGDVWMAMDMPPKDFYINVHPNCFHLWQRPYPQSYMQPALAAGINPDEVFWRGAL